MGVEQGDERDLVYVSGEVKLPPPSHFKFLSSIFLFILLTLKVSISKTTLDVFYDPGILCHGQHIFPFCRCVN